MPHLKRSINEIVTGWCEHDAKRGRGDDAPSISSHLVSNKKCDCPLSEQWNSTGLCIIYHMISNKNYFNQCYSLKKIDIVIVLELVIT